MRTYDVATSFVASIARLGTGMEVAGVGARPEQTLELYEFESCPFCRKVREALSILDLDAMIYPCPQNGPRFRPKVIEMAGKAQFPYFIDRSAGREMYESDLIVGHLFGRYGDSNIPWALSTPVLTDVSSFLASAVRATGGRRYRPATAPQRPLELWSFEASPYCRLVRERLCELEIPYLLHNVAKGSTKRKAFETRAGKIMVPFLVDPNTGVEMFESGDICAYLDRTYAKN